MNAVTIVLVLAAVSAANGQLNFEGNPLTENTEYTAMESRYSERTMGREVESAATNGTNTQTESSGNLYPLFEEAANQSDSWTPTRTALNNYPMGVEDLARVMDERQSIQTARQFTPNTYSRVSVQSAPAELALNSFLNSKTPEESRASLDHYLQSRQHTTDQQQLAEQTVTRVNQQTVSSPVNQHLTAQLMQQRTQAFPVNQQPMYNVPATQTGTLSNSVAAPLVQQQQLQQQQEAYATGIQARNDVLYPGWYQRMRRVRGKPFPYAQSRVGPGFYGPPIPPALPFKPKGPPVEVIYTKPPGFHRGPPPVSNPPVPYEDASAWFPDAEQPPPSKDVFYSQLYAQSYDPYYYNYIAKTGKIKPHLYGKLGKYHEEEGDGIWAELYRGFKKHGLKNMMTPTFLLGMTLPVITLMLTALVQKRSMARSDGRGLTQQEDKLQEYLEQIQRAVECYEKRRRKRDTDSTDECWS